MQDVTEQKNAQAQVLQADRLATLGTLAASVAHEINNPLAALIVNVDVASEDLLSLSMNPAAAPIASALGQVQDGLGDAREAAQRVRQVLRDLHGARIRS